METRIILWILGVVLVAVHAELESNSTTGNHTHDYNHTHYSSLRSSATTVWTCQPFNSSSNFCGDSTPKKVCSPSNIPPFGESKSEWFYSYILSIKILKQQK